MPTMRRSRTLRATPEELWAIVGDAHHLPRWWPRVTRVEGVDEAGFTIVLQSPRGATVRADYRVLESEAPRVWRWAQDLVNSPFERVLASSEVSVALAPEPGPGAGAGGGGGTRVTLTLAQRLRGVALFGGLMVRGAGRRQLDEALDGLEALVG